MKLVRLNLRVVLRLVYILLEIQFLCLKKNLGRLNRTLFYFKERAKFLHIITKEIRNHEINCKKHGLKPVIRLNTTSDIMWENHKIMELFPNVIFYDYSKHFKRMMKYLRGELPDNYHLTFSLNEKKP